MQQHPTFLVKAECHPELNETILSALERFNVGDFMTTRCHFHCTLLYAKNCLLPPSIKELHDWSLTGIVSQVKKMSDGKAVALVINSERCASRNKELVKETGGVEDYEYIPHITIGYTPEELTQEQTRLLERLFLGNVVYFSSENAREVKESPPQKVGGD